MIRSFRNRALLDLWTTGRTSRIDARLHKRIMARLDRMNVAGSAIELSLPGFNFHILKGFDPPRFTIHVNGPWCLTFEFSDGDVHRVDLEQYH